MGGPWLSMRRICTGEVWVRSITVSGSPEVEVERVPHPASRVGGRHVERLEVVPVGLGLGALGHDEPHPDEDVLELVAGALDDVQAPPQRRRDDLGEVQPVRLAAGRARSSRSSCASLLGQVRLDLRRAPR